MTDTVAVALIAASPGVLGLLMRFLDKRIWNKKLDHITVLTNSTLTDAHVDIKRLQLELRNVKMILKRALEDKLEAPDARPPVKRRKKAGRP